MNTITYFEIQASEPEKAAAFYNEVFGWNFEKDEHLPIEYYRITNPGVMMGAILKRPTQTPPTQYGTNAFTCSVFVENFDDMSKKILDNGGQVAMAKFAVPGKCWQGYFLDIDNNVFGIYQADENAQ